MSKQDQFAAAMVQAAIDGARHKAAQLSRKWREESVFLSNSPSEKGASTAYGDCAAELEAAFGIKQEKP